MIEDIITLTADFYNSVDNFILKANDFFKEYNNENIVNHYDIEGLTNKMKEMVIRGTKSE